MKSIFEPSYQIFIGCLKEIRIKAGLTQAELGELIGTDQTYVSKYETRERRLDLIELRTICQALGVTLTEFVEMFEQRLREST